VEITTHGKRPSKARAEPVSAGIPQMNRSGQNVRAIQVLRRATKLARSDPGALWLVFSIVGPERLVCGRSSVVRGSGPTRQGFAEAVEELAIGAGLVSALNKSGLFHSAAGRRGGGWFCPNSYV